MQNMDDVECAICGKESDDLIQVWFTPKIDAFICEQCYAAIMDEIERLTIELIRAGVDPHQREDKEAKVVLKSSEPMDQDRIKRKVEQDANDAWMRENEPRGNLYRSYVGWSGCADQDCLAGCRPSQGHCERLRLFIERAYGGWE